MCGSSHKAIRYRWEMQSIVSPTPCIIDRSFDGSAILEEGKLHFCIHSIAKREAVQKTTPCIARGNETVGPYWYMKVGPYRYMKVGPYR